MPLNRRHISQAHTQICCVRLSSSEITLAHVLELQSLIGRYIAGERSARELFRSIQAFAVQLTREDADPAAKQLYDRAWLLLVERSQGDRTDDEVRRELKRTLREVFTSRPFRKTTQTRSHVIEQTAPYRLIAPDVAMPSQLRVMVREQNYRMPSPRVDTRRLAVPA
jgi:hypothetical protein